MHTYLGMGLEFSSEGCNYPGMDLDFSSEREVQFTMMIHLKEAIKCFPKSIGWGGRGLPPNQ